MPISEFDRRIELNKYIFGQTDYGGNIKALVSSYDIWARLRSLNGSKYLENLQLTYSRAFEITTRYESTRQLTETDEIVYEDFVYLIQSITKESEGKKKYNKIIAYTTGTTSNTGEVIYRVSNIIHFTGTGTEYSLQDNRLIGWESLLVFRDGIEYRITVNAPLNKEVRYDKNTGELFFSTDILPLQNGEAVDAYLITKSSTLSGTSGTTQFRKVLGSGMEFTILASEHLLSKVNSITVLNEDRHEIEVYFEIRDNGTVFIKSNTDLENHILLIY